jgi:dihydrolipoamide dehydrogenase
MGPSKRIIIIGAGPGGYVAAIRAAQLGAEVTVIENQALGGVCLNSGCIPSKALLSVIELREKIKKASDMGLRVEGEVRYDLTQMVARKNRVVSGLVGGIATLFKTRKIIHIEGTGALENEQTVRVQKSDGSESVIQGDAIIVATGSSWPNLPQFPIDGQTILTSKEALDLITIPASIVIIGGGVEGCEFATYFSGLGAKVTVVEMMSHILPQEDEEIANVMLRELKKRKVDVHSNTTVKEVGRIEASMSLTLSSGFQIETETVLVSVGRQFNTQGIGLEKVGVQLGPRGEIEVNDQLETNVPGIYAIGDVVGKAMLAHVASAQGKIAVENAMGHSSTINYEVIPAGIFTLPEIGRVGLTEQQVQERGIEGKVGRFRYAGLGKAQGVGETIGMFKVIADAQTDALLGVHIIGAHAADLIHEAALAMELKAPASAIAGMIHAHPTLSEGMMEAAEDLDGLAIHQAPKRK